MSSSTRAPSRRFSSSSRHSRSTPPVTAKVGWRWSSRASRPYWLCIPDTPWRHRDAVELSALREEPFVTLTHASRLRHVLEAACHESGFAPRIAVETTDLAVMVMLAAEGVGVALLPRSGLDGAEGVVALDVLGPRVDRRIVLVWRADYVPPAARAFLESARLPISAS